MSLNAPLHHPIPDRRNPRRRTVPASFGISTWRRSRTPTACRGISLPASTLTGAGVALRGGAVADGRGQALQEGGERNRGDLEDAVLVAEKTFRRLDAPELLADVASGVVYVNGVRAVNQRERKA